MTTRVFVAGHKGMVGSALGWRASIGLEDGLRSAYAWFVQNATQARG